MADVYLAEQHSLQRKVAIKTLKPDLAKQADYVQRFHNEARAVAALVHANIVQIYEVGCIDGIHFIAQEYVPGQTVKQLVNRSGTLSIPRVVSVLRQIAAALGKAVQGNIVHRDIKPENILLSPSGEAKVADFGLARVMDVQNVDLTQAGLTMGTPLYMSPEQVEGRQIDHRSDLYSCGVTAYFMLAGRPPFEGDTPLSVAVQHLQNAPPPLDQVRPDAPSELIRIVNRLLAKKPSDRYSHASELLKDLRALPIDNWDKSLPTEDETLDIAERPAEPSGLHATQQLQILMDTRAVSVVRRRRPWLLPALLAVVSCVAGAAAAHLSGGRPLLGIDPSSDPAMEKKATIEDQYWHAFRLNTIPAWENVRRFHSENTENRYYSLLAQKQLAWLYFQEGQIERSRDAFQRLTKPENDPEFRTIGHAGLAIIFFEEKKLGDARSHVGQVGSDRQAITGEMRIKFDAAAKAFGT